MDLKTKKKMKSLKISTRQKKILAKSKNDHRTYIQK
jgi:hypothetical protein